MPSTRKIRVTWTQREETLLAVEIHRMRNGESTTKGSSGRTATSLHSMINLAMTRVLPKDRWKSNSAVYTTAGKYDEQWYQTALQHRSLYEQTREPAAAAAPAAAASTPPAAAAADDANPAKERVIEVPEEPTDPETEHLLMLGNVVDAFARYIGASIKRGVKEALVELRNEEEAKLRADGNWHDTPDIPVGARQIVKRKIDVIGLMSIQRAVVQRSPVAKEWDIRFLMSGKEHGRADLRDKVIICSKFVSHSQQNRYRQMGAGMHWANGGANSVIRVLEELSRQTANGNHPVH